MKSYRLIIVSWIVLSISVVLTFQQVSSESNNQDIINDLQISSSLIFDSRQEDELENFKKAQIILEKVLSKETNNPIALNNLAYLLIAKNSIVKEDDSQSIKKAIIYLNKAINNYKGQESDILSTVRAVRILGELTTITGVRPKMHKGIPFADILRENLRKIKEALRETAK